MFEARLAQGSLLKKVIEAVSALTKDINIEVTSTGLAVQAMDEASVALVFLEMDASAFDPFRCDKNITLGVNTASFLKVLRCASNDDSITLRAKHDSDSMEVFIENTDQDRMSTFEIKLMDIDNERLGIPEREIHTCIKLPSMEFQRIIRDITQFGDAVVVTCTKEGVQFATAANTAEGSVKITLKEGAAMDKKCEGVHIELNQPVIQTFACRYIGLFVKASPLSDHVTLTLTEDAPMELDYPIGSMGHLRYYLAPKIEED